MPIVHLLLLIAILALAGCNQILGVEDVTTRDAAPPVVVCADNAACTIDRPRCDLEQNACVGCSAEADCDGYPAQPHCLGTGACVACRDSKDCAAMGNACDPVDHVCRECKRDQECPSSVCEEGTGTCVPTAYVLYVDDERGSDGNTCTNAQPCKTIGRAHELVNEGRQIIVLAPGAYEGATLTDKAFHLVGYRAVILGRLDIAAAATLEGFEVRRGKIQITPPGPVKMIRVSVVQTTVSDTVAISIHGTQTEIIDSNISNNHTLGVYILGDTETVTIRNTAIVNNEFVGVLAINSLTIDGCTITDNLGGGIEATVSSRTTQRITNNIIARNGGIDGDTPALKLVGNTTKPKKVQIEHNTITQNSSTTTAGINCYLAMNEILRNNIVFANSSRAAAAQVGGDCLHTYSVIGPEAPPDGSGNVGEDPLFVDPTSDYHLRAASPAHDGGDPVHDRPDPRDTVGHDFDGDSRPIGARDDVGADEIR